MIIKTGETRQIEFSAQALRGLSLKHYVSHDTVNTALTLDDSNPAQIYVKLELLRDGRQFTLFQDNLRVLAQASSFANASFELQKVGASTGYIQLVAAATEVKAIGLWAYVIDMKSALNLSGSDRVQVTVTVNSNSIASDCSSTISYLDVDSLEAPGEYEHGTPYIKTWAISANESRVTRDLGDNVTEVVWINTDKSSQLSADAVISNMSLNSKFANVNDVYIELLSKNLSDFSSPSLAGARYQSLRLYHGLELDAVTVDLQLQSANVNASKNFLVAFSKYTDARLLVRAQAKEQKHAMEKAVKVGVLQPSLAAESLQSVNEQVQATKTK